LKERARLAFIAHQQAERDGDTELASAALARFQAASDALKASTAGRRNTG
jgi:hypothetical protein